jgi:hypothetical protein
MNSLFKVFIFLGLNAAFLTGFGQTITSQNAGPWNVAGTWAGGTIPTNANSTLVQVNHAVSVPSGYAATAQSITIAGGVASLNINSGGSLSFTGVLNQAGLFPPTASLLTIGGTLIVEQGATITPGTNPGKIIVNNGGVYRHNYTTSAGSIYSATWNSGSTLEFTGYTSNASPPSGLNQSFNNVTWNCPGQIGGFVSLDGTGFNTVNGDLSILNTNFNGLALTVNSNLTLTVGGDLIVQDYLALSIGTGNTTIDLSGDLTLGPADAIGNYAIGTATLNFKGVGTQTLTNTSPMSTAVDYEIFNGSTLAIAGSNFLSSFGTFDIQAGASLSVGSPDGLATGTATGSIRVGGTRTYNTNANIIYSSSNAQNLGNEWGGSGALNSAQVNLEIDNSSAGGVTNNIIGTTSLLGGLTLTDGSLNIGNSNTLDIGSDFVVTGGTIGGGSTSDLTFSGSGALGALTMTPGATSLRDLTVNRASTLVMGSDLTIVTAGSLALDNGNIDISGRSLTINGSVSGSQGILTDASSNLIVGGSGAFGTIPILAGSINNITLSRSSGTYNISSAVTIETALDLNRGTLSNTGITMADGADIFIEQGSMIGSAPSAAGTYNVTYDRATGETIPGVELPTSGNNLNDLIVNTGGFINLGNDVDIAGDLLLQSGEFRAGTNDVIMSGTGSINDTGGSFTQEPTGTTIISGSTTLTNVGGIQFGGIEIQGTGTLNAGTNIINVQGIFNLVTGGIFNAGTGTVTFNGPASAIQGASATFHNLGIGAGSVLTASSATTNVSGSFVNTSGTFIPNNGIINLTSSSTEVLSNVSAFDGLTINGSGEYDLGTNLDVNSGLVLLSGTLDVTTANRTINIGGSLLLVGGSLNSRSGVVVFDGTLMDISGPGTLTLNNMLVSNGTVRNASTGGIDLLGTLTMSASTTLDADGTSNTGVLTLKSSSGSDARIAALGAGAVINGTLTFERFLPSFGDRRWRNIGSAVAGATIADMQNEIPISGTFTGSDNGTGGIPSGALASLAYYNESLDLGIDDNWVDYPSSTNTETFAVGRGYSIYVRETADVTFDLRGTVNQGNISLPVSGTGSTPWNLVSNPYPSSIDWDNGSGWTRSNIQGDAISVWNGLQYLTWNGSTGSLGNGRVPMGMAFWVQASNSSISLNINENAKTSTTGTVHREITPTALELSLTSIDYPYTDKAHIEFVEGAEMRFDKSDLGKLPNAIFNLATTSSDDIDLSINAISNFVCGEEIPISITNLWVDTYRLNWSNVDSIDPNIYITLIDKLTGEEYDLRSFGEAITMTVTTDSDVYDTLGTESNPYYTYQIMDRFSLSFREAGFSTDLFTNAIQVCEEATPMASVIIEQAEAGVDYDVYKNGVLVVSGMGMGADLALGVSSDYLNEGENEFTIKASRGGCAITEFSSPVLVDIIKNPDITYDDGLNTLNTSALGAIQWYRNDELLEGETGNSLSLDIYETSSTANYYVTTSNDDCERLSEVYIILGLEDGLDDTGIEVYPNPAKDNFYISLDNNSFGSVLLRIHSSNGLLIDERVITSGETEIDVSSYENGLYLIELIENNRRFSKRVVKQ